MQTTKFSISLSQELGQFVETYKSEHNSKSRSQVIEVALELLRSKELETAYMEASQEVDPLWDITVGDGLKDESW